MDFDPISLSDLFAAADRIMSSSLYAEPSLAELFVESDRVGDKYLTDEERQERDRLLVEALAE